MFTKMALLFWLVLGAGTAHAQLAPKGQPVTADALNAAQMTPAKGVALNAGILRAQVLLDRAGLSPGAIDARNGENFRKALIVFQQSNGLTASGALNEPTWTKLTQDATDPVVTTADQSIGTRWRCPGWSARARWWRCGRAELSRLPAVATPFSPLALRIQKEVRYG